MRDINTVAIGGNLGKPAELKHTPTGTAVLEFSVCCNTSKKIDGEWTDKANWLDCVMFGKRSESLSGLLDKGAPVTLQGHLEQQSWTTSDGSKRSKIQVIVDEITVHSRKKESGVYEENIPF